MNCECKIIEAEMDKRLFVIFLIVALVFTFGCLGKQEMPIIKNASNSSGTAGNTTAILSEQNTAASVASTSSKMISIHYFSFIPNIITVSPGTTVVWKNNDNHVIHHFISGYIKNHKGVPDGLFDSGKFNYGQSWNYTFNKKGEYPFYSPEHIQMQGLIIVGGLENNTIQISTPHFVGSIPSHNRTLNSLNQIWITFSVPISNGSSISVYDITHNKPVELKDAGIAISNYLRLKAQFQNPLQPATYKVSYTEVRSEGTYYGQFFFDIKNS